MALNANALASQLQTALDGNLEAWKVCADTIGKYLQQNAMVTWVWAGATQPGSPPTPDPLGQIQATAIVGNTNPFASQPPADFDEFAKELNNMILGWDIMIPLSTPTAKFGGDLGLKQNAVKDITAFPDAMSALASAVVSGFIGMVNSAPISANRPPYMGGTASGMVIS